VGVKSADAGASGADALGQVALRHQFQFQLARAIQRVEDVGIGLARKRADDLAHLPALEQRGQAGIEHGLVHPDRQQHHRQRVGRNRTHLSFGGCSSSPALTVSASSGPAARSMARSGAGRSINEDTAFTWKPKSACAGTLAAGLRRRGTLQAQTAGTHAGGAGAGR